MLGFAGPVHLQEVQFRLFRLQQAAYLGGALEEAAVMAKVQMDYVRGGAAKFFMDGVWESYTAFNIDPYADAPDVTVEPIFSLEHFTRMAAVCDRMGLQVAVHCCGGIWGATGA